MPTLGPDAFLQNGSWPSWSGSLTNVMIGRSSSRRNLTKLRVCSLPALRWVLWPDACFQSCAPRLGDRQDLFAIVNYLTLFGNWASALFNDIEQNPMTGDRTT